MFAGKLSVTVILIIILIITIFPVILKVKDVFSKKAQRKEVMEMNFLHHPL